MSAPRYYLVFDVESVGLHGDAFAFGLVVIDAVDGREVDSRLVWCDPSNVAQGAPSDRDWVANHIPPFSDDDRVCGARDLRESFWAIWNHWASDAAWMVADCPWPVEARFLLACVADEPIERMWQGPYPLIDVASVRLAAGLDPLGTDDRHADELPMHNPLADARQSARLLREALIAASPASPSLASSPRGAHPPEPR
jgi:hypothetical protein